eukprot:6209721-Pleurochrysis_carterae.AAC.2
MRENDKTQAADTDSSRNKKLSPEGRKHRTCTTFCKIDGLCVRVRVRVRVWNRSHTPQIAATRARAERARKATRPRSRAHVPELILLNFLNRAHREFARSSSMAVVGSLSALRGKRECGWVGACVRACICACLCVCAC